MLSTHQENFHRKGYLLLPNLIEPAIIEGMLGRVADAIDLRARKLYDKGKITNLHEDLSPSLRWQRIFQDMGNFQMRRSWDEDVISEELHTLMTLPALLDVLESLLGPEIQATGLIALRPKVPNDKRTTVLWHQDSHYFGEDTADKTVITVWVPLVDANESNGCLQVIPESHTWGYVEAEMDSEHKSYKPLEDPTKRGTPLRCEMRTGDVLLFGNLMLHRSLPNVSDHTRWSIDFRYHSEGITFARKNDCLPGFRARGHLGGENWETWFTRYKESGIHTE